MADLVAGLSSSETGRPGPTTLIGVAALADPDLLVEIDVIAVTS
jgi:enamine deaminase RidA (YjgF/YER057c/UK114 family)